jgi:hypothetical protein
MLCRAIVSYQWILQLARYWADEMQIDLVWLQCHDTTMDPR